jgi:hypothetical protein
VVLDLRLLRPPLELTDKHKKLVNLLSQFHVNGIFALEFELIEHRLRVELEAKDTCTEHVLRDLVGAMIDKLEDLFLEKAVVAFNSVLEVRAKLGPLKDGEACWPVEKAGL